MREIVIGGMHVQTTVMFSTTGSLQLTYTDSSSEYYTDTEWN